MTELYKGNKHVCPCGHVAEVSINGTEGTAYTDISGHLLLSAIANDSRECVHSHIIPVIRSMSKKNIAEEIARCDAKSEAALTSLQKAFCDYADALSERMIYKCADAICAFEVPKNTGCKWVARTSRYISANESIEEISNDVYAAQIRVSYGEKSWKDTTLVWSVSWDVHTNSPVSSGRGRILKVISNKAFTSKEAADAYIAGRKEFLEKTYFFEKNPMIPRDIAAYYKYADIELPFYRYEHAE